MEIRGTTIVAVRKDGKTAMAGDGQVTAGQSTIMKSTAVKVRRIFDDRGSFWGRSGGMGGVALSRKNFSVFLLFLLLTPFFLK